MAKSGIKEVSRILVLLALILQVIFLVLLLISLVSSSILAGLPRSSSLFVNDILSFFSGLVLIVVYLIFLALNYALVYVRMGKRSYSKAIAPAVILGIVEIILGVFSLFFLLPGILLLLAGIFLSV
jgi:hypothetical protein